MRRTSSRSLAAVSLLALLAALAVPNRAEAEEQVNHATTVRMVRDAERDVVRIVVGFSEIPAFTARLDRNGLRLVVDVPNADLQGAPTALTEHQGVVGGVMAQAFQSEGKSTTRLLVTLLEQAKYSVSVDGTDLVIALAKDAANLATPRKTQTIKAPHDTPRVKAVRFEHTDLEDRVLIDCTELPEYRQTTSAPGKYSLTLKDTELGKELSRTLDVSAFGGVLSTVSSFVPEKDAKTVVIQSEGDKTAQARASRRGNTLIWSFSKPGALPSSMTGVGLDGGIARKARTVHVENQAEDGIPVVRDGSESDAPAKDDADREIASEPAEAGAFAPNLLGQNKRAFTGRRIDLDLKDADVHNVLRLLADVGQVNIVTADNVSGTVTIRMRNVPWDQALDVVLQAKGLGVVQRANMLRVAPLADLEKERELQIARRQQEVKLAPLETRLIPVSYAQAGEIQERAKPLLSERGSIAVDDRTNVMIVRDLAGNLNQIEELTRSLDTQTPQVLVEARIVEATSRYIRDVGIQWGGDTTFSSATGNPTGLAFPSSVGLAGGASDGNTPTAGLSPFTRTVANPNFAVNLPAAVGTGSGGALGLTLGSIDNTVNLAVRLSAAESSGMLRILSSPRILTLDNREARISQGTLIPFSQVSAQGVQTTFQEAKLQLLVKPHVTADGSVSMHVKINRDEPDYNQTSARGDPTILKREAETDLLVMDGHTAVIGGIFTRNTGRNLDQVPFFGDIPILGILFQRRRASDTRGELVIFLTPRIVNRAEALGR
ncbi:MAG TPA: type IV pilus secretin PilQ [Polyangiaceae bacterium]|nr:type IV pilus secretin PilQ [Polyangiaceae bacterium]